MILRRRGGYPSSNREASDLPPPPTGSAPGMIFGPIEPYDPTKADPTPPGKDIREREHPIKHHHGRLLAWVTVSCGYEFCSWMSLHLDVADAAASIEAELAAHLAAEHNEVPT